MFFKTCFDLNYSNLMEIFAIKNIKKDLNFRKLTLKLNFNLLINAIYNY